MRRPRRNDRGVTIVEAAFALPIMILFISGLVDLGMWTFNSNQATNAARDGARAGILSYELADVVGSADNDAVVSAVREHLPADTIDESEISVECLTASGTTVSCASAQIDTDRIRVEVEWKWNLVTPIAPIAGVRQGAARGSATMAIVGLPLSATSTTSTTSTSTTTTSTTSTTSTTTPDSTTTTTAPPADCAVEDLTISPDPVDRTSNGASQLAEALHIDFTTNGSTLCGELSVELISSHTKPTTETANVAPVEDGSADYSWTYVGSSNIWKAGTGTVRILWGTTLLATDTFQVN